MKTVIRYDRGTLRRPSTTSQGFLRADGIFGRPGIYEYRNDDGTIRRELRLPEEIRDPESLASFADAPVTIGHPPDGEVTAENVRRHEVGAVTGPARPDGEDVAGSVVIKDAAAIKLVKGGKQELSPGYKIKLDETPGTHPKYGRYDAIQRDIRVNHLAIVDRARGGSAVRLRMDAAEIRADSNGKLTTAVVGHQHLIDLCDWNGAPRSSGCTSWAVSEGKENDHEHAWIRGHDGKIVIGEAEGHTHAVLDDTSVAIPIAHPPVGTRSDGQFDRSGGGRESRPMDKDEQIRSLKEQLAAAEAKLAPLATTATRETARADAAEATVDTLRKESEDLRAQIASAAQAVETAAVLREKVRADAAEAEVRNRADAFEPAVEARVALERRAAVVMPELNMRGMPERTIISTIVKRLDAQQDTSTKVTDAYLRAKFDTLIDLHERHARGLQRVSDVISQQNEQRTDSLEERRRALRNQWQEPLPNSREAQTPRGKA